MTNTISLGQFEPRCPQCGAQLMVERRGAEVEGDDRLLCPKHGDQGSVREFRDQVRDQTKDDVVNAVRDIFRRAGFKSR